MPRGLAKPFVERASFSYDEYNMSMNFLVVESDRQIKAYLKSRTPEEFKAWFEGIRAASKNTEPIDSMLTYEYFTEGMDKPYKNDITEYLIVDLPKEKAQYCENLYYLLSTYSGQDYSRCKAINALKGTKLAEEWKAKFLALCGSAGCMRKSRRQSKGKKTRKSRNMKY
jgi:hypothetical protein